MSEEYKLSHLKELEAESIHIIREVAAEFENPVMLYSIGKDSSVMVRLAEKAFAPGKVPFPLMHIDSKWKFKEMIQFRDEYAKKYGWNLIVESNMEAFKAGVGPFTHGSKVHTDLMKTQALLNALDKYKFDAAFGGARRDEEKSRAKERIFSFRNEFHQWNPKNQRPELWDIYNARIRKGESIRVFPLSNWTELDIWQYILPYIKLSPVAQREYADTFTFSDTRVVDVPKLRTLVLWVPLMELISEREYTFFRTRFFLVTARTSECSIEFVFIECIKQGLCLHQVCVNLTSVSKRSYTGFECLHIAFNDKVPAIFLGIFIAELNHFFEFPFGVYMHKWEWNLARCKSFFSQTYHYRRVLTYTVQHDRVLKFSSHFAYDVDRLSFQFFQVAKFIFFAHIFSFLVFFE